ncbi:MAG: hypothetical protein EOM91_05165 [Sphingobacteriia bacterium]|nr:hypothetical protein [Sphingobacteriia bacterium]NCC38731.1 hypothetical protein [Gammaproteobacteria bacterium]
MTDRHRLAAWSLELDDARFAQTFAALGVIQGAARRRPATAKRVEALVEVESEHRWIELASDLITTMRDDDSVVEWQMPSLKALASVPSAVALAEAWQRSLDASPWGTRIAVRGQRRGWSRLVPMLRTLQQPSVGAGSVFVVDVFAADGRIDWQLPFHFSVLPGDPLAEAFSGFQANWREPWPYRFTVADRMQPRVEILVCLGGLRQVTARLLTKGSPSRAAVALLLDDMKTDSQEVEDLTRLLARELSAEGVVCVRPTNGTSLDWAMQALVRLGDELTHNRPLDMALHQVFGQEVIAILSRDLLRLSHLSHAATRLSGDLRTLSPDAWLAVSERSLHQLIGTPDVVDRLEMVSPQALDGGWGSEAATGRDEPLRRVPTKLLARGIANTSESYRYFRESDEASSLTEVMNELKGLESARAAEQPETRYIQHSFWRKTAGQLVEERRRMTVGVAVLLRVRIGPPEAHWQAAPEPFPAHELPPTRRRHRLQIVFHEPNQLDEPMVSELMLPRVGPSSVAELVFTPRKRAPFEGRITLLHRGRVLQTVLLFAQVALPDEPLRGDEAITQQIEARVREHWSDLGTRRRFDASFVLNHNSDNRPLLTGVSGKRAWVTDLSGIEETVGTINQLLTDVARSVPDYSEGLTKGDNLRLFYTLARLGADLYSALVMDQLQPLREGGMDVEEATHLQIISTRADAVVPFELIYQYEPPDDECSVKLCPNALEALASGACPSDCDGQRAPRRHVCPMGFWSLRKVIERHLYNPAIAKPSEAEVIVQAEPAGNRVRLQLDQAALVGYSIELTQEEVSPIIRILQGHLDGPVREVKDWDEWKAAVSGSHPTLLVAFPHNTGDKQDIALEIGGKPFKTLRLPREYVHLEGPYPLVMLLGCDVASTAQQYASHIRYFRQAGAAAIVSTIATVFGPHAVKVGEALLAGLLASRARDRARPDLDRQPCLGEVLREVKRKALLESLPMALCIVAFGDADWRL